jgi:glycosyltransferase involved in cell wall biosynthesis
VVNSLTGDAAALIEHEGCGVNYQAGSIEDLCRAISVLLASPSKREACSIAARRVFATTFESSVVNSRFVSLIENTVASSHSEH